MTGILNTTSLPCAAAAALSAAPALGCAALSGGGSEAIPADAMKRPVDLSVVCVLVNEDVKSEPLVKSLETGVRRFGATDCCSRPATAAAWLLRRDVRGEDERPRDRGRSVPDLREQRARPRGVGPRQSRQWPHGRQCGRLHGPASQSDEEEARRQGRSARRTRARSDSLAPAARQP